MTVRYDNAHFFEPVRQILERVLGNGPLAKKRALVEVWTAWPEAVGPRVSAHTTPMRLDRGVLTVRVDSAPWHHQLQFLEAEILSALQTSLPQRHIKSLRFLIG